MAVLTVIPTTDVKLNDVRDTLNANGGSVNNDISTFFTDGTQSRQRYSGVPPVLVTYYPNANINKWAKNKPIDSDLSLIELSDDNKRAEAFGLSATTFSAQVVSDELVLTGLAEWAHNLPLGGTSSPFRLADFKGYNPHALPPINPPTEISWNIADGGACPSVVIPFRYDATKSGEAIAAMECEASGVVGANAYLCLITAGTSTPYVFVANAGEAMSLKGGGVAADAYTIQIRKFSFYSNMANSATDVSESETGFGWKYNLHYGINIIAGRALNKVFTDSALDLSAVSTYDGSNDTNYNGASNLSSGVATFMNLPEGEKILEFYSYWLVAWMYDIVGPIKVLNFNYEDNYSDNVEFFPGVTTIHAAYYDYINATYRGYCDIEFTLRVANNGASIQIGSKIFTKGGTGLSAIVSLAGTDTAQNMVSLFLQGERDSQSACWLPLLKAYNHATHGTVYTQFEAADMGLTFGSRANAWKSVYGTNGALLGYITATGTNTITYNGNVYSRLSGSDKYTTRIGDKYYGIYKTGATPEYGISVILDSGETVDCPMRLRVQGDIPMWMRGISTGTTELINFLLFNTGIVNKISESGDPVQYPYWIGYETRGDVPIDATCFTAAATVSKVVNLDGCRFLSLQDGDRLAVNFTYANSASSPTLKLSAFHYDDTTHEYPVEGTIASGINYFYFTTDGTDRWVKYTPS